MKKKVLILSVITLVIVCLVSFAGCSFLGTFYTDRTPYYIDSAQIDDAKAGNIVANNNLFSAVRVITSYRNGKASAGTGFIVTEDGYVVTNRHCVVMFSSTGSDKPYNPLEEPLDATYQLVFVDDTVVDAYLVAYSKDADLAVLKIRKYLEITGETKFDPVTLAKSDELYYGDKLFTIGNPEDMGLVLTEVMVSSPGIKLSSEDSFKSIILDGTINHGNSGGALFDCYGNVVGVVYARVEGSNKDAYGIGCGIPLSELKSFLDEVKVSYTVASE